MDEANTFFENWERYGSGPGPPKGPEQTGSQNDGNKEDYETNIDLDVESNARGLEDPGLLEHMEKRRMGWAAARRVKLELPSPEILKGRRVKLTGQIAEHITACNEPMTVCENRASEMFVISNQINNLQQGKPAEPFFPNPLPAVVNKDEDFITFAATVKKRLQIMSEESSNAIKTLKDEKNKFGQIRMEVLKILDDYQKLVEAQMDEISSLRELGEINTVLTKSDPDKYVPLLAEYRNAVAFAQRKGDKVQKTPKQEAPSDQNASGGEVRLNENKAASAGAPVLDLDPIQSARARGHGAQNKAQLDKTRKMTLV